ncbi:type I restriction endonuclease subunit S [Novacetimonas maltaceti]|uniref:Type I restriction modification DNA specificity domain protein n=1 Tax=Novacetimonas maltaceti TaxID=1203393 RepID=A0A2S3W4A1_9PROT|nr:restriction endonuclease subunit S [Novacetimonas maltaceti]POF63702.1 Type I restriction modification DNA specificity domain protein [Novacetimonas maltaceti]PYD61232.1 type I restriction endonuclease subunit S [Novacetimonas maltaceti]
MSFPKYPAYKESGLKWVGEIPTGWNLSQLSFVFENISSGTTPSANNDEYYRGNIPWVTTGELREAEIFSTEKNISSGALNVFSALKIYPPGTLLVAMYGATTGRLGWLGVDATTNQACCALAYPKNVHFKFIFYSLLNAKEALLLLSSGGGQPNINQEKIRSFRIPIPPLPEQQAIASFLDRECGKIDALIAEQERLIALLAEKRQAVISHAVTKGLNPNAPMKDSGIPWIGMVPEGWEMMRVKNILLTIEQGWSPQCENYPRSSDSEWAVLKVGCVNTGIFDPSENKVLPETLDGNENLQVRAGDVLVSRANTRDLVGRSAVAERNYSRLMICDKIFRLRTRPEFCLPEYLSFFLQSSAGRHVIEIAASGASQSMVNIGQGTILEMLFPVPPVEIQRHILKNLNCNDEAESIGNANQFINLAYERRAALISAAVTGKIDVRNQNKANAA